MHGKFTDSNFYQTLSIYLTTKTLLVGVVAWEFQFQAFSFLVPSLAFTGQKILLGLSPEEETAVDLNVQTELVSFTDLGGVKPSVVAENCAATVQVNIFFTTLNLTQRCPYETSNFAKMTKHRIWRKLARVDTIHACLLWESIIVTTSRLGEPGSVRRVN